MKEQLSSYTACALLAIFICAASGFSQRLGSEEYRVYSTVLRDVHSQNRKGGYSSKSYLVILNRTEFELEPLSRQTRTVDRLESSFRKRNLRPAPIEERFPPRTRAYKLASKESVEGLLKKGKEEFELEEAKKEIKSVDICGSGSWRLYEKTYPGSSGFYTLSRVGFNGRFALVRVKKVDVCSGFSNTYVLKKVRGRWLIHLSSGSAWVA